MMQLSNSLPENIVCSAWKEYKRFICKAYEIKEVLFHQCNVRQWRTDVPLTQNLWFNLFLHGSTQELLHLLKKKRQDKFP